MFLIKQADIKGFEGFYIKIKVCFIFLRPWSGEILLYETLSTDPSYIIHALYLRTPDGVLEGVSLNYDVSATTNKFYYYHRNAHGDITVVTDSNGNVYREYTYDPYGNIISVKDGSGSAIDIKSDTGFNNAYLYAGYYYDQESGLYFLNSRYYAPGIGRFITKDSEINSTTPQSLNLYAYVNGDPVNLYDSDGHHTVASANGHDSGHDLDVDLSISNNRYDYKTGTIRTTNTQKSASSKHGGTTAGGFSASAAAGIKVGATGQIVKDTHDHEGVLFSISFGGGTPSVSVGYAYSYTDADRIYDLKGEGADGGTSYNVPVFPFSAGYDIIESSGGVRGHNFNAGIKLKNVISPKA